MKFKNKTFAPFVIAVLTSGFFIYISLLALGFFAAKLQATKVAQVATDLVSDDLLIGDYRTPIVRLQNLANRQFCKVSFFGHDGKLIFETLSEMHSDSPLQSEVRLKIKEGQPEVLVYQYDISRNLLVATALFFTLSLLLSWPVFLLWKKLKYDSDQALQKQKEELLVTLAAKLTHDIRSPMTALKVSISKMTGDPDTKELASRAIDRITTMSSSMLMSLRETNSPMKYKETNVNHGSGWPVASKLKEVLKEKELDKSDLPIVIRLFGAGEQDARATVAGYPNIHYMPRGTTLKDAVHQIVKLASVPAHPHPNLPPKRGKE